jgi:hypothetical protein
MEIPLESDHAYEDYNGELMNCSKIWFVMATIVERVRVIYVAKVMRRYGKRCLRTCEGKVMIEKYRMNK